MKISVSKTVKFGPLNVTVSPNGATMSIGAFGMRASINTKGQVGFSASPGGGFSFRKKKKVL